MGTRNHVEAHKVSEEYQTEEFPIKYHEVLCNYLHEERLAEEDRIILRTVQEILSGMKEGKRMIDFGCGPTIHMLGTASRYYEEIICADYSDYNIKEVEKWLKKDEKCLDWNPFLEMVAHVEGYSDIKKGAEEIGERIRTSVKNVIRCDLLADPPVSKEFGKFDLLLTSYVIESVCTTRDMYKKSMKKLCDLIEQGGTLMMVAVLDASSYLAHKSLHQLPIDEMLIKNSLEKCGMKLKSWHFIESNYLDPSCRCDGIVILSAEKN